MRQGDRYFLFSLSLSSNLLIFLLNCAQFFVKPFLCVHCLQMYWSLIQSKIKRRVQKITGSTFSTCPWKLKILFWIVVYSLQLSFLDHVTRGTLVKSCSLELISFLGHLQSVLTIESLLSWRIEISVQEQNRNLIVLVNFCVSTLMALSCISFCFFLQVFKLNLQIQFWHVFQCLARLCGARLDKHNLLFLLP